jgi:hypothetical protein
MKVETETKVSLLDGKYTFIINEQLQVVVLRYGEPWRQFEVGDKAMYSLVTHAIELEEELIKKNREIDSLREVIIQSRMIRLQDTLECQTPGFSVTTHTTKA